LQLTQFAVQTVVAQVGGAPAVKYNPVVQALHVDAASPPAQAAQPVIPHAAQRFVAATLVVSPKPAAQPPGLQKPALALVHVKQLEGHAVHVAEVEVETR
jgi:hypothetical protein